MTHEDKPADENQESLLGSAHLGKFVTLMYRHKGALVRTTAGAVLLVVGGKIAYDLHARVVQKERTEGENTEAYSEVEVELGEASPYYGGPTWERDHQGQYEPPTDNL